MAYNRQPQSVLAGTALKQSPPATVIQPAGIIPVTLDCELATTTSLGVVQVGSGLAITPLGVLSATGGSSGTFTGNVHITAVNYTALATDYYIGATQHPLIITLPLGVLGKVYVIKNQANGSITLKGTGVQTIDSSLTKNMGSEDSITVLFNGTRWNIIN